MSATPPKPRFRAGDKVRVDDRAPTRHCRAPWYLRGHTGTIAAVHGNFRDPERLAYMKPGLPLIPLYKVRFRQADLWPAYAGPARDHLEVDLAENWLAPDAAGPSSRRRKALKA